MILDFQEDENSSYKERTCKNASADVTIAIAQDFTTAGEVLTKKSVLEQGNLFIPISINVFKDKTILKETINKTIKSIDGLNKTELIINIAGNGIYTLKESFVNTQGMIDYLVYYFLDEITSGIKCSVVRFRTGGQSGVDEAGAKAGIKLGIPTLVLAPKGWRFRDIDNNDIANEEKFKNRFK